MPFTVIYALIVLLVSVVVFGVTYKKKGIKTALVASVVSFFLLAILWVAAVNIMLSNM